jgi:tRNA-dihydrouridine synthase
LETGETLPSLTVAEVVENVREQLQLNLEWKDNERSAILMMRRHFAKYFPGLPNFRELKIRLLRAETSAEVTEILDEILEKYAVAKPDYSE